MTSEVTAHARAFVEEHLPRARGLGIALADQIDEPEAFVTTLQEGLENLADDAYAAEQQRVAQGSGAVIGVRWPLWRAVARQLRTPLAESSPASAVWLAQRLVTSPIREIRLFALVPLERSLATDPERTWQLLRRLGHAANDWISVDAMADLIAQGILREPFRWAELEQLVYSPHRWERRLVGSTLARLPFQVPAPRRGQIDPRHHGLAVIESLIGDADPAVQKALGWALREWTRVDQQGVSALLLAEADRAALTDDGHRSWVIRDALSAQPPEVAREVRARISAIRRRTGSPATSVASKVAASYGDSLARADQAVDSQGERMAGATR